MVSPVVWKYHERKYCLNDQVVLIIEKYLRIPATRYFEQRQHFHRLDYPRLLSSIFIFGQNND